MVAPAAHLSDTKPGSLENTRALIPPFSHSMGEFLAQKEKRAKQQAFSLNMGEYSSRQVM